MGTRDARVDAYIARSADFAKPILSHIRDAVHAACPAAVETIKWGHPHFEYKGILCGMASFNAHCGFGFRHAELLAETPVIKTREAMGQFGRITRLAELPKDAVLKALVRKAAQLNEAGIRELASK